MSEPSSEANDGRKHLFHLLRLLTLGLVLYSAAAALGLAIASNSTENASTSPASSHPTP